MPMLGIPMPLAMTETGMPLYVPVKPSTFLTDVTSSGFSRKFSAIYFALSGSPGIRIVLAKAPSVALMCGVIIERSVLVVK